MSYAHRYHQLARRTESLEVPSPSPDIFRLLHAALGISTETAELIHECSNKPQYKEELGDLCWYLSLMSDVLNINFDNVEYEELMIGDIDECLDELHNESSVLVDQVKRIIFYGTEPDYEILEKCLSTLKSYAYESMHILNIDDEECFKLNIEKLKLRYPEKFDSELAVKRNIKAEQSLYD